MRDVILLFDLDGTLIDTAPDLIEAVNHAMVAEGLPTTPAELTRSWISHGGGGMLQRSVAASGQATDPARMERMLQRFLDHYGANIAVRSRPYPGLLPLLDRTARNGALAAVCTNKREVLARKVIDELGLTPRFQAIAGWDTFPVCKPHPDHLTGVVNMAGGDGRRVVMVGDSDTDVKTARAAGVPIIGVSFGYSEIPMRDLEPDALIDTYDEFGAALDRILGSSRRDGRQGAT
jgi:phosphoglycolate phosphatase